jgi:hypothetical protein
MTGTLHLDNHSARYALKWAELETSQALKMAPILASTDGDNLRSMLNELKNSKDKNEVLTQKCNAQYMGIAMRLLRIVLDPDASLGFKYTIAKLLPEHYARIIASEQNPIQWCFTGGPIKQLVPSVFVNRTIYYGPRDFLGGIQFGEYLTIQDRYQTWTTTKQLSDLCRFFSVLYRPEDASLDKSSAAYHNDCRQAFVANVCDANASLFAKANINALYLAVLYWQGCHERLRVLFPKVFEGVSSGKSVPGEVILRLAGSVRKNDVEEASQAPALNVMMYLNMDNPPISQRQ